MLVAKHCSSPEIQVYRNGIVFGSWQAFQTPGVKEGVPKSLILLEDYIN